MTDSFFHIDPADNLALTDIVCFFIQLLIACLRRIALQIILPKNSGAFDSSQMSPSTITYDLNVASMAENRVKCSRGDMSHAFPCDLWTAPQLGPLGPPTGHPDE